MINTLIGIDPGLNGAVSVINDAGNIEILDAPVIELSKGKGIKREYLDSSMASILKSFDPKHTHIFLEKIHSMPGQGVTSMFSMGVGYGLWRGIVAAYELPLTLVTPQEWKKTMMKGMGKEKAASCYRAQQLYPDISELLFGPRGGPIDGRGDSLLIAAYGRLQYGNN